jgi:profilin
LFQVTPSELTTFANNYSSPEFFQANGLTLAGIRFIFLSGTDRVLRAKKNKSGLHCMKTEKGKFELLMFPQPNTLHMHDINNWILFTAIVVSIYEEPTTPQQAANVVEKLGEYLRGHGY